MARQVDWNPEAEEEEEERQAKGDKQHSSKGRNGFRVAAEQVEERQETMKGIEQAMFGMHSNKYIVATSPHFTIASL